MIDDTRADARRRREGDSWVVGHVPILLFLAIYIVTCLLGALLFLAGYRPFIRLFEYFSGSHIPHLDHSQALILLTLLCGAPLCLWLGYIAGRRIRPPGRTAVGVRSALGSLPDGPPWLPLAAFVLSGAVAFVSLARAGALKEISAWFSYGRFINERELLFSRIGFLPFVNIYIFLPFSGAWAMVSHLRRHRYGVVVSLTAVIWTEFIDLLLFQKKSAVISLLILGSAWLFYEWRSGISRRRLAATASGAATLVVIVFLAAVVVPVYSQASTAKVCVGPGGCTTSGQVPAIAAYSLLSPVTRSSSPVLYYPLVYPSLHPYYGLDLFQDELGLPSAFATDNQVIWKIQNPHGPSGTSVAPFQFSLYSGTGLAGALIESMIIGVLMGLCWRLVTSRALSPIWSSLLAASEVLFAVYLSIDSWRNDTTVSYGALWALFFVVVAAVVVSLLADQARSLRSWRGATVSVVLLLVLFGVGSHDYGASSTYVRSASPAAVAPASGPAASRTRAIPPAPTVLPSGWSVALHTVKAVVNDRGLAVTTTPVQFEYQLQSPVFSLDSGPYNLTLTGQVRRGSMDLGITDSNRGRWIAQALFPHRGRTGTFSVQFTIHRRSQVRVILANGASRRSVRSQWVLHEVAVRPVFGTAGTSVWRLGP